MIIAPPRDPDIRRIYDALVEQMKHRQERTTDEWISLERDAVRRTINAIRIERGLGPILLIDVLRAERLAQGHVDYARKYAIYAAEMTRE